MKATVSRMPSDLAEGGSWGLRQAHRAAAASGLVDPLEDARLALWCAAQVPRRAWARQAPDPHELAVQAGLVRCVFASPFLPAPTFSPSLLAWGDGTIGRLAAAAYEYGQLTSGELDRVRLAVLADAVEEAGCVDELLSHLRGAGLHVRGCWALDAVLGKE